MTITKKQETAMDAYLQFSGGYRLANLKKSNSSGMEYKGYDADISFEGTIIGHVADDGDGGGEIWEIYSDEHEKDLLMHAFRLNAERRQKYCAGRHIDMFLSELEEIESLFKTAHTSKKKTFFLKSNSPKSNFGLDRQHFAVNSAYSKEVVDFILKTDPKSFIFSPDELTRWPVLKIAKSNRSAA